MLPDDDVGFLDWQMVRRGNWSLDLGYFVQGALTIEERRRSERELLDEYRAALTLPADEMPSQEDVLLRYRASVAHGLAIWMAYSTFFSQLGGESIADHYGKLFARMG